MAAIASEIESLSLNVTEEMLVRSSCEATFAALLEEWGLRTRVARARRCR